MGNVIKISNDRSKLIISSGGDLVSTRGGRIWFNENISKSKFHKLEDAKGSDIEKFEVDTSMFSYKSDNWIWSLSISIGSIIIYLIYLTLFYRGL